MKRYAYGYFMMLSKSHADTVGYHQAGRVGFLLFFHIRLCPIYICLIQRYFSSAMDGPTNKQTGRSVDVFVWHV